MLDKEVIEFLRRREFVSVATCNLENQPNAAPKFFLKAEKGYVYLVDYTIGKTWHNIKINPRVSLSLMDTEKLLGYQINGSVEIIDKGAELDKILKELEEKEIIFSAKRISEGVVSGRKHADFEVGIGEKFDILKIKVEEISRIGLRGKIEKEKVC